MTAILALCLAFGVASQDDDPRIRDLTHQNWEVRESTARNCGRLGLTAAIPRLISMTSLTDEPNSSVRSACVDALRQLTGLAYTDHKEWSDWWEREGADRYRRAGLDEKQFRAAVQPMFDDFERKLKESRTEIRYLSVAVMLVGVIFVLVMFYFVGHVSSKLKEWKELVGKAEAYIKQGEEITQRTDRILSELDAKRTEVMEFFSNVKDDNQAEFERFCDILQKNLEHRMREEVMGLRQKAEKELEQTLGDVRTQVEHEIRRGANEHREKMDKEAARHREELARQVDAERLTIQAKMLLLNDRPEEALRIYKRITAEKPDHVLAWTDLGLAWFQMGRFEDAVEGWQKALSLRPGNAEILYNVAKAHAKLRQRDRMLEVLAEAIANDGEYKDEALNDPAFRDYWNDPKFKDLAEA